MILATTGAVTASCDSPIVFRGPFKEMIPRIAKAGYSAVEMHIYDSGEIDRKELWDTLKEYQIKLTSIGTGSIYEGRHYCLTDRDPHIRELAVGHLEKHMVTAEPDHGVVIIGLIAGRFSDSGGEAAFKDHLTESLHKLDELALRHDVFLGLELMNRFESDYLTTIAEGVEYRKSQDFKRIFLHLDTVHMNIEEGCIRDAILSAKGHIGHVHVADNDRWYPGHGHYDFRETLQALKDIGYKGTLALETNCYPSEEVSAAKSLKYITEILESLD